MATFGAMSWRQVPPVGTPVWLAKGGEQSVHAEFGVAGYHCGYYQSGTAALAQAIKLSLAAQTAPSQRDVILPGYGCPDLVAACVYAGANPVIIDIAADKYTFDLAQVEKYASDAAAIVCPSLLGICMPIAQIKDALPDNTKIIEDDAQWFPEADTTEGRRHNLDNLCDYQLPRDCTDSDFILTSFGRGKPVNLLGGGMLLSRIPQAQQTIAEPVSTPMSYRLKSKVFNALMNPLLYGALVRLPGLDLGSTNYHALDKIAPIEKFKRPLIPAAIRRYLNMPMATANTYSDVGDCAWADQSRRLLRLPLLVDNIKTRNKLVTKCIQQGISATAMYQKALHDVPGVATLVKLPAATPVSQRLAATLVTLPTHAGVTEKHKALMHNIVKEFKLRLTDKVAL
ncbi:DegT/DnrJ/EryC1/StrS family aminotransferase [Alteromonas sp. ASW11-36]|uniref:DegT/DnrJ/EryC1/StrS family aminotransferase n=1 Tax=Alteromonas arenosi TaxID=3055817 RepID=A0ABT7STW1_9ALTE|nr:DegT/DnrJ/EryC1/StrS family aminotransferase [Alteromonas sp. ASW11-36]MDM7859628.1 DegT/DnrJ/EryC1/StrS family aminotransferase [Alteromonas sp. ASW11-36]